MTPSPGGTDISGRGRAASRARGLFDLAFKSVTRVGQPVEGSAPPVAREPLPRFDLSDPDEREFGDYELLAWLGEGGTGAVYRARHRPLEREVAIKLLSAGAWASPEFVARFEREAQHAARMQHPNIVTVFETGTRDDIHFFSMRLVEGQSLSALLKRGERLPPKVAASLMRTVAEAVAYAHSLGVLHLDLKPGNVLIDAAGQPHVADFGLARRPEAGLALDNDEVSGTPSYMAPEQTVVHALPLTAATDVWGLGAVLYEVVTGHAPFLGKTAQATLDLVTRGQVRAPRRWEPRLPLDLQAIVLKCLRKDPAQRYPTARALADDLGRFVEGRPVQARLLNTAQRVWRWTRREPKLAATALLAFGLLLAGLVASVSQLRRADASANGARENLWATRAQTAQQALANGDGFHSLRPLIANLREMETSRHGADASVERQRIGTILANAPQLVDLLALPRDDVVTAVAIAPDGQRFAVATAHGEWVGPPHHVRQYDLGTLRELWSVATDRVGVPWAGGDAPAPHAELRYSHDGRFVLVSPLDVASLPTPRRAQMLALDARDGKVLVSPAALAHAADIVFDDDAKFALLRYRSNPALRWPDSAQFYEVAGWHPRGPRHTSASTLAADLWLPAPAGTAWLGTRDSARITLYDVPSLRPRWHLQLPSTSLVRAWQFSRDGKHLALGSVDGAVRLVDTTSGEALTLGSASAERVARVEFSPDGETLAAVDEIGQLRTWGVSSRLPLSAPVAFVHSSLGVRLRFVGHALFGGGVQESGQAEVNYVGLAPRAPFNIVAVPGAVRVRGDSFGTAFDVSHPACRLVTGIDNGLVGIWRLPISPVLAVHAAPLLAEGQGFDGHRVVAADGERAYVVDAATGEPLSPPLLHPEPVRFADLSPDGHALVTIAGRTLRVIDPQSWRLRGAPIVLPQTPQRVVFAQGAPTLLVTTSDYDGEARREQLHRIDLAHGVLLAGTPKLGALTEFALDAQGRHALLTGWDSSNHAQTGPRLVDLERAVTTCAPALGRAWGAMALAPDGRSAWFSTESPGGPQLQRWDLAACRRVVAVDVPGMQPNAVLGALSDGGVAVHRGGSEALVLMGADGSRWRGMGDPIVDAMHVFALSADTSKAAFAARNAVYLIDARRGRRLSAPLAAPIAGDDAIARLTFSADGTRLLARTINGRWLYWSVPRTSLDVVALARLARVVDPDGLHVLDANGRAALRKQLVAEPCPSLAPVPMREPIVFAPAAGAQGDRRFLPLDLRSAMNTPLLGIVWPEPRARGDRPMLAPGPQRFLGVDYRVDGGVQLIGGGTASALGPHLLKSKTIAVPDVVARRAYVLVFMHSPVATGATPQAFARVVLVGATGRETPLQILSVRDVVTDNLPERAAASARIAFAGTSSALVRSGQDAQPVSNVYAVALEVPAGVGPICGVRFEVAAGSMEAPLFYAATLELAAHGAGAHNE